MWEWPCHLVIRQGPNFFYVRPRRPSHCLYHRSSIASHVAPDCRTTRYRYSARPWPGRILRGTNCSRAHPCAAAGRSERWWPLAGRRAQLLSLVQDVCPRLLEKRAPLFSKLNRIGQGDGARNVWHFAYYFQRRVFTASRLKIEPKGLGQSKLRYSIVVLRGD